MSALDARARVRAVHRRTLLALVACQILGGLGFGATVSMGSLLFAELSGTPALSGMASTMSTLGAALAAIPLARLAQRSGRRLSLSTGAALAAVGATLTVLAAAVPSLPLLFVGIAFIGMGNAANLQARFAATDLAAPEHRGRDLSVVVWSTTIGAVVGPNLLEPGEALGFALGLPHLTGPFVLTLLTQLVAVVVYLTVLRPDPLLLANELSLTATKTTAESDGKPRRFYIFAVVAVSCSHAVMVAIMAMTPVHLTEHGASLTLVGITISLHVAGMFALSPVFGILADRLGKVQTVLIGQGLLALGVLATALGSDSHLWVTVGLALVGLGWSAATIAGSALVTESTPSALRTRNQGRNDLVMSLAGATGGALAGPVLAASGYPGLSIAGGVLVAVVVVASLVLRSRRDLA
ncbi:MFS transporter [Glaciihabitans arcticus]|uniref:MFS transporter n=1 Tax=Glaciihabitans arcticus TaxID=2668039 RepID=A0A4Q9GN04_9MICO|nr:MFS transporter [Glaciihabitans arcticus]TBN56061.1 MFS transporter [Glaciihabitans arcticus]